MERPTQEESGGDAAGEPPLLATAVAFVERRFGPLPDLLRRADRKWEQDPAHVHRLRVATRRADATLTAFRPLFKPGRVKKMRRRLRDLRRAAREPRECDVHLVMLEARADRRAEDPAGDAAPGVAEAIRLVRHDRVAVQAGITRIAARHSRRKMMRRLRRLLASACNADSATVTQLGREHLRHRAAATRAAAAADLAIPANLHRLRLSIKKLRYAVEIFGPYSDLPLRETLVPRVKEAGERLGRSNDAHDLARRLGRYAKGDRSGDREGLASLAAWYKAEGERESRAFLEWWQGVERSGVLARLEGATPVAGAAE